MSATPEFAVGGSVHLCVNNQIGYTTDAAHGRCARLPACSPRTQLGHLLCACSSSRYATDLAKAVSAPVLHVNGDSIEVRRRRRAAPAIEPRLVPVAFAFALSTRARALALSACRTWCARCSSRSLIGSDSGATCSSTWSAIACTATTNSVFVCAHSARTRNTCTLRSRAQTTPRSRSRACTARSASTARRPTRSPSASSCVSSSSPPLLLSSFSPSPDRSSAACALRPSESSPASS